MERGHAVAPRLPVPAAGGAAAQQAAAAAEDPLVTARKTMARIFAKTPETWKLPPRTYGLVGPWTGLPGEVEGDLRNNLATRESLGIYFFPNVRIEQLIYPAAFDAIVATCKFKAYCAEPPFAAAVPSPDKLFFRLEPPRSFLTKKVATGVSSWRGSERQIKGHDEKMQEAHPYFERGFFTNSPSRFPGFDRRVHYDIFAYPRATTRPDGSPGDKEYIVIQAIPSAVNKGALEHPPIVSLTADGSDVADLERRFRLFRDAKCWSLDERTALCDWIDHMMSAHFSQAFYRESQLHPIYRMIRAPILFYIWPQQEIMAMKWSAFTMLADMIELGQMPLPTLAFSWLWPATTSVRTSAIDAEQLCQLELLLQCEVLGDMDCRRALLRDEVMVELMQRGFEQAKSDGHTFQTFEQLYASYLEYTKRKHCIFDLRHLILMHGGGVVMNDKWDGLLPPRPSVEMITDMVKILNVLPLADQYCIIKRNLEQWPPSDPKWPLIETEVVHVLYAGDDWIKQHQTVTFFNTVINERWRVDIHAGGCRTEDDVRARIGQGPGPEESSSSSFPPGAPRFRNADFQRYYAKLDERQRSAVHKAVLQPLTVIGGPPGTGKTDTLKAIAALFGGPMAENGCVPLAAYGRIAENLRQRLDGAGHTFHRASATAMYGDDDNILHTMRTLLIDEGGLVTHHHMALGIAAFMGKICRIIITGDPDQMDAIGSGSFFDGLVLRFRHNEQGTPRYTHLETPHRFLMDGKVSEQARKGQKPLVDEDMAIHWNMKVVLERRIQRGGGGDSHAGFLDFAYSSDLANRSARLIISALRRDRLGDVLGRIFTSLIGPTVMAQPAGIARAQAFTQLDLQIISQRHDDVNWINCIVYDFLFGGTQATMGTGLKPAIRCGERVSFTKNGYFLNNEESSTGGGPGARGISDTMLERAALTLASTRADARMDVTDYIDLSGPWQQPPPSQAAAAVGGKGAAPSKKRARPRDDNYRGLSSDDTFNGRIKSLKSIVDVSRTSGEVQASYETVKDKAAAGSGLGYGRQRFDKSGGKKGNGDKTSRLLIFDDDTQLNVSDDYDLDKVIRAYAITSKKMQGSESKIVINYLTPTDGAPAFQTMAEARQLASTLYREELYTNMTRAKIRFYMLVPLQEVNNLVLFTELDKLVSTPAPPRQNTLATRLAPPKA
jgi:hypothetical protein